MRLVYMWLEESPLGFGVPGGRREGGSAGAAAAVIHAGSMRFTGGGRREGASA